MRAYIVVDLGFGDSGKGLLTDFLVRHFHAGLVVRYNGGAQAGHNVVTPDGRHHTFSQFGSGTFQPHVKTYLSKHVVVHPTALLVEGDILAAKGVQDPFSRLCLSDQALVITPFHQSANRIRELVRGTNRHGSCGVGVGETVEAALQYPEGSIRAGDLNDPVLLKRKLQSIREQIYEQMLLLRKGISTDPVLLREYEIFEREDVTDTWLASIARIRELGIVTSDEVLMRWMQTTEDVVFEGAQGVLLDAAAGFHPYTTWSNCTAANALELVSEMARDSPVFKLGVIRSYAVRHGPGPLPTETNDVLPVLSEHNQHNEWQGAVRYGWFDSVLTRYSLNVTGGVDSLVVTHMDALSKQSEWKYCSAYRNLHGLENMDIDLASSIDMVTDFHLSHSLSLEERAKFTKSLFDVTPVFESCRAEQESVIPKIESLTGQQVSMISRGPTAHDVQMLKVLPS